MERLFIFFSPTVERLLLDNRVDVVARLNEEGLSVQREFAVPPGDSNTARGAALVLMASATVIGALGWSITRVIDALGRNKKSIAKNVWYGPAVDENGVVIRDANGQAVMCWSETPTMLEANKVASAKSRVSGSLGPERGLAFDLISGGDEDD